MEKEFIPYEEALALKEIGFGASPIGGYQQGSIFYYEKGNLYYDGQPMYSSNYHEGQILAPLYQQVFRWFRKKYGLICIISMNEFYDRYKGLIKSCSNQLIIPIHLNATTTYEEAELECLKKLIEIAKKDDN